MLAKGRSNGAVKRTAKQSNIQSNNQTNKQANKQSNNQSDNQSNEPKTKKQRSEPTTSTNELKLNSSHWQVQSTDCLDTVCPSSKSSPSLPDLSINLSATNDELDVDNTLIDSFLFPVTKSTFLPHSFARRALAIKGGGADRVQGLIESLGELDPRYLMSESPSESIFVWMRQRANEQGYQTMKSFGFANPEQIDAALACYEAGNSLYFRAPSDASRCLVRSLTAGIGLNFAGIFPSDGQEKGEVETFLSRAGHVTDWHTDFQHNFTIQLQGCKTWHFASSTLVHPLRGATPHYEEQATFETQQKAHSICDPSFSLSCRPDAGASSSSVTLQPGDVLFHPAGIWHRVECVEDSISINVSLIGDTYADCVADACRQLLWKTDARSVVHGDKAQIRDKLKSTIQSLQSILTKLTPDDVIPTSRFVPRSKRIVLDAKRASEFVKDEAKLSGTYRRNPLFVAVERPVEQPDSDDEDETEGEFSFDDSDDNEEDNEDNDDNDNEDDNDEDENDENVVDSDDQSDKKQSSGAMTRFALHHGFGNEELQSSVRVSIHADELSTACMQVLGWTEKDFHAGAHFEALKNPQVKGAFISTLAALVEVGFFTPL